MTLQSLQALLSSAISGSSLVIDANLNQDFGNLILYLGVDTLTLENVPSEINTSDSGKLIISGSNTIYNNKTYQIDLEVFLNEDGSTGILLTLSPTEDDWSFADFAGSFPEMATADPSPLVTSEEASIFETFIPDQAVFILSNTELSTYNVSSISKTLNLAQGINFNSPLTLSNQEFLSSDTTLQLVLNIASGDNPIDVNGTIELTDTTPLISLDGVIPDLSFGIGSFSIDQVGLQFITTDPNGDKPVTYLMLAGNINLGSETVQISAPLLQGDFVWDLNAEFEPDFLSLANGFDALATLAGGSASDFQLPSELSALSSFYLASLTVGFSPTDKSLSYISFTVATSEAWNTPIPNFSILEINTNWTYLFSSSGNSISGEVSGLLQIGANEGAVNLEVTASMPDFQITAQLPYGDQIVVQDLLNYYFGNSVTFDTSMIIDQFSVLADTTTQTYSLTTAFQSVWEIDTGGTQFSLDPVNVNISYDNTGMTLDLGAQFNLELTTEEGESTSIVFVMSAQKAPDGQGWQFQGTQASGSSISIGTLIDYLAEQFGADSSIPDIINNLTLSDLSFSFNTLSKDFSFTAEIDFPINDSTNVALNLEIALTQAQDGTFSKVFQGQITLGSGDSALVFDIIFDQSDTSSLLLGSYQDTSGKTISLSDLLGSMMGISIPDVLSFSLNNALYLYDQSSGTTDTSGSSASRQLFVAQMGNGLDLSALPLVGSMIGSNPIKIDYQFLIPSETFVITDLEYYNTKLPSGFPALPTDSDLTGIKINVTFLIGEVTIPISLPITTNTDSTSTTDTTTAEDSSTTSDSTTGDDTSASTSSPVVVDTSASTGSSDAAQSGTWFTIQKQLGPVYFDKIGLNYSDSKLWFLIQASLTGAGLTISLDGLGVGSPLTEFDPTFSLSGIGIDYQSGNVNIGGSFLASEDAEGNTVYSGSATITTSSLSISALGSYTTLNGSASLFIYATVNKALGGPSFFYVTGLAAGFGYNRQLIMPSIEDVNQFPLVTTAMQGTAMPTSGNEQAFLTEALNDLNSYIPPAVGQNFLAAGVQFTTYNLLTSFALLSVSFGNKFRIDIIGLSNLVVPPDSPDFILSEMQLSLTASFVPDDGTLQVTAQLTNNSYFLSPDCQLTGGFAFYAWFSGDYEGDFVLSIGGYHPQFNKPDYYPDVPRLGFNWKVDNSITLSGEAYFALCAHAFMVGGSFSAVYASGDFEASFNMGADFIISWQPYYYSASIYSSLGCTYTYNLFGTHTISIELGATLDVWGPDFGGKASVKILIFTIKIKFGDQSSQSAQPISYDSFKSSFLPVSSTDSSVYEVCTINITGGLTGQSSGDTPMEIVNAKNLVIATNSEIPAKILTACNSDDESDITEISLSDLDTEIGVAPMDKDESGVINSTHTVTLKREGIIIGNQFAYSPVVKKMPKAIWGTKMNAGVNDDMYFNNGVAGIEVTPGTPPTPGQTQPIPAQNLAFDTTPISNAFDWETFNLNQAQIVEDTITTINDSLNTSADMRSQLLDSFNLSDAKINIGNTVANNLLYQPTIY